MAVRRFYELWIADPIAHGLNAGDAWVDGSSAYGDRSEYLPSDWEQRRSDDRPRTSAAALRHPRFQVPKTSSLQSSYNCLSASTESRCVRFRAQIPTRLPTTTAKVAGSRVRRIFAIRGLSRHRKP